MKICKANTTRLQTRISEVLASIRYTFDRPPSSLLHETRVFPILTPYMDKKPPKDWLYIISPCVLASALAIFAIIYSLADLRASGGWSYILVPIASSFLLAVIAIDVVVRLIVRRRAGLLWLIEIAVLILTVLIFRNQFM